MWILILFINMNGIILTEFGGKYNSQSTCTAQGQDEMRSLYQQPVVGFRCVEPQNDYQRR